MIGQIKGKIVNKKPTQSLIDVNGIGYIVNTSINTFEKIPDLGEMVSLFTYLSVREDSLTLFGFFTLSEKEIFEILIGVNGVGPKLAQNILSGITSNEFKEAVMSNNISRLIAIPGVGRKTAERMIIELRDKIIKVTESGSKEKSETYSIREDSVAAIVGLGYNYKTADKLVRDLLVQNPSLSLEDLIKESLKNLTK